MRKARATRGDRPPHPARGATISAAAALDGRRHLGMEDVGRPQAALGAEPAAERAAGNAGVDVSRRPGCDRSRRRGRRASAARPALGAAGDKQRRTTSATNVLAARSIRNAMLAQAGPWDGACCAIARNGGRVERRIEVAARWSATLHYRVKTLACSSQRHGSPAAQLTAVDASAIGGADHPSAPTCREALAGFQPWRSRAPPRRSATRPLQLGLEIVDGGLQVVAALGGRLGERRIGEMRRILDAGAVLLGRRSGGRDRQPSARTRGSSTRDRRPCGPSRRPRNASVASLITWLHVRYPRHSTSH